MVGTGKGYWRVTLGIKRRSSPGDALGTFHSAGLCSPCFRPSGAKKLYQKHYPLWGGLNQHEPSIRFGKPLEAANRMDYFRAVSTGPATPAGAFLYDRGGGGEYQLSYRQRSCGG